MSKSFDKETKKAAAEQILNGESYQSVMANVGCGRTALNRWTKELRHEINEAEDEMQETYDVAAEMLALKSTINEQAAIIKSRQEQHEFVEQQLSVVTNAYDQLNKDVALLTDKNNMLMQQTDSLGNTVKELKSIISYLATH